MAFFLLGFAVDVVLIDQGFDLNHSEIREAFSRGKKNSVHHFMTLDLFTNELDTSNGSIHGSNVASFVLRYAPGASMVGIRAIGEKETKISILKRAFQIAIEENPKLILCSFVIPHDSNRKNNDPIHAALINDFVGQIKSAADRGIIIVVAAGNDKKELSSFSQLPGELGYYPNIITVGGTFKEKRYSFSNYSRVNVDFVGEANALPLIKNGVETKISGTSFTVGLFAGFLLKNYNYIEGTAEDFLKKFSVRRSREGVDWTQYSAFGKVNL